MNNAMMISSKLRVKTNPTTDSLVKGLGLDDQDYKDFCRVVEKAILRHDFASRRFRKIGERTIVQDTILSSVFSDKRVESQFASTYTCT